MKKELSKLQILIIRACKSHQPERRLTSIYKRFYLSDNDNIKMNLIMMLSTVVQDANITISLSTVHESLNPNAFRYNFCKTQEYDFNNAFLWMMIDQIRFSDISLFKGYVYPVRFRRD